MKPTRAINLLFLACMPLCVNLSCHKAAELQKEKLESHDSQVKTDTSFWLKETRGIRDVLEDEEGSLWFASPDYIAKFNGQELKYFSSDDGLDISGNLHKDSTGAIWVENGFRFFRHRENHFTEVSINKPLNAPGLWFQRGLNPADTAYTAPGIYALNGDSPAFIPFPLVKANNNKYLYYPSTKATMGQNGTVWFGTMEKVFGLKNGSFISLGRKEMGRSDDERNMGIRGIFVDSKGSLWIADNGAGVFKYNGKTVENFTQKHQLDENDTEGPSLHRAFSVAEDSLGNMWFGTVYSGIWVYSPKTNEFKNYTKADGVNSDNIWKIYRTKKGRLLFAGESPAAVYAFNGKGFERIH